MNKKQKHKQYVAQSHPEMDESRGSKERKMKLNALCGRWTGKPAADGLLW